MEKMMDLKIYGQGSSGGGKFKNVIIKGKGQIMGDVDCHKFKVYGECEMEGDLKTELVDIKGQSKFKGDLKVETAKIQGEIQLNGSLFADEAIITGNIKTDGDCNAEIFKLEGGFTINGLLNADMLEINIYWPCKAREIGGSEIKIKKENKISFLGLKNIIMPGESNKWLDADIIEGDNIYLENTEAKVVRGNKIELGPGCEIELVEYGDEFINDKGSEVKTQKKM
jgi:cytoskeletal protein CcmA (bactofilin family)